MTDEEERADRRMWNADLLAGYSLNERVRREVVRRSREEELRREIVPEIALSATPEAGSEDPATGNHVVQQIEAVPEERRDEERPTELKASSHSIMTESMFAPASRVAIYEVDLRIIAPPPEHEVDLRTITPPPLSVQQVEADANATTSTREAEVPFYDEAKVVQASPLLTPLPGKDLSRPSDVPFAQDTLEMGIFASAEPTQTNFMVDRVIETAETSPRMETVRSGAESPKNSLRGN